MSYSIHFDKWGELDEAYDNLTWDEVSSSDELLTGTEQFSYWLDETYPDEGWDSVEIEKELANNEDFDISEIMEDFRDSDAFWELQDTYVPIYNYVHLLSSSPYDKEILMVAKYVGNAVIVHLNDIDADVIALTGCGMDFSDNIELAYYLLDGESPIQASQIMSLGKSAEKILKFFRRKAKGGRVTMFEIERFIDSGYEDEEEK